LHFRDGLVLVYRKLTAVGDQCWMVLLSWLSIAGAAVKLARRL